MIWGFTVAAEDIYETKVILRRLEELTGRKIVRNGVSEVVNGSTMQPTGRACFYLDMDMERKGHGGSHRGAGSYDRG